MKIAWALSPFSSLLNCWNEEITLSFDSNLFLASHIISSKLQSPWHIFSDGIWRPSMLSCKFDSGLSLLSSFLCCSIGVITLSVDLAAFSGSLRSVYFFQQVLTVFTWRTYGFFFKQNISLATKSQGIFFLLPDLRNISINLSSNSLPLELYFLSLPPPLRFS